MALFLLAALVPLAGLQLIPYLGFMALFTLLVRGRSALPDLLAAACGGLAGLVTFWMLLQENGVWPEFLKSVSILGGARRSIAARLANAIHAPFSEPSSIVLLALLCLCLAAAWKRADARLRTLCRVRPDHGNSGAVPHGFAGKYMRYYSWMAFIPMAACVAAQLEAVRIDPDSQVGCAVTCFARVCRRPAGAACHHVPGVGSQGSRSCRPARRRRTSGAPIGSTASSRPIIPPRRPPRWYFYPLTRA